MIKEHPRRRDPDEYRTVVNELQQLKILAEESGYRLDEFQKKLSDKVTSN
jgi:hypothetical protein